MLSEITFWPLIFGMFTAVVTAVVAAVTYTYQKSVDRKNSLVETRRTLYRNYMSYLIRSITDRSVELHTSYDAVMLELTIVGTDDVIFAVGEFNQYANRVSQEDRDNEHMKSLIAKIVLCMRKDCFSKTELDLDTIRATLPFR